MKRRLPLLVLAIILFNIMGYYLLFSGLQYQARYNAQVLLKTSPSRVPCTNLKISKKSARNHCKRVLSPSVKEFCWNGEMYDVLSRTEKGDTIYLYCYADHEETMLIANFLNHVGTSVPAKSDDSKFSLKNLVQLFYLNQEPVNPFLPVKQIAYGMCGGSFLNQCPRIISPPPEAIVG